MPTRVDASAENVHWGYFDAALPPIVTIDSGDVVTIGTVSGPPEMLPPPPFKIPPALYAIHAAKTKRMLPGHMCTGPVAVRGARAGDTLAVTVDELRVGTYGFTDAGGWPAWLNTRLGLDSGETRYLQWSLDADAGTGADQFGRTVELAPFLGVMGMPPAEAGVHATGPPRACGGNLDCTLIRQGTTLYLPIPVDGALFSAGDGHARQGDGEVCQLAIEAPMERVRLTLDVETGWKLQMPVVRTSEAWVALGVDEDLDEAAALAVSGMLDLMERERGLERRDAYALASVVVDLRVTQVVNGVKGVHAVLRDDAWS